MKSFILYLTLIAYSALAQATTSSKAALIFGQMVHDFRIAN